MIQANELRIGNWINVVSAPHPYGEELGVMECVGYTIYLISTEEDIKAEGIPLTEEWLLRFGYLIAKRQWDMDYSLYENTEHGLFIEIDHRRPQKGYRLLIEGTTELESISFEIKTVHRFQNIIHSLINKEPIDYSRLYYGRKR